MTKLQELLKQINRKHVYIQTHNFPDPDAIASAMESGRAMIATMIPEIISLMSCSLV